MIRRLEAITGDRRGLRRAVAQFAVIGVLQGLAFVLLVPVLRALLAEPADTGAAARWLLVLAAVGLAWAALYYKSTVDGYAVGLGFSRGLRHRLGGQLGRLPLGWFAGGRQGSVSRTVTKSVDDVMGVPAHLMEQIVTAVVTPATVVAVTLLLDWRMAAAFLVTVPVALLVFRWSGRVLRGAHREVDAASAEAAGRVIEFAQAQPVLRSTGRAADGHARLVDALAEQHRSGRALLLRMVAPLTTYLAVVQAGFVAVLLLGTYLALDGQLGVPEAVALLVLAARFVEPLVLLADLGGGLRVADNALDRIEEVLAVPPLPEPATAAVPADATVELDGVTFSYGDRPVLTGVSFVVPAGTTTALVGASGSGKTTVTRLVARFWDTGSGAVRVGGVDVRDLPYAELMGRISMVFQEVYLFDGTMEDNVRLGRPQATDAELAAAARAARLDEVVGRLPAGWETRVGEGGVALSGGERQRVSIARALLKDAPVVLLDEATAALDPENEAQVLDGIAALTAGRTVVVIAHRLATVVAADQIVVLDRGRVAEVGRHAELLAAGGRYAAFWAERRRAAGWRIAAGPAAPSAPGAPAHGRLSGQGPAPGPDGAPAGAPVRPPRVAARSGPPAPAARSDEASGGPA